MTEESLIAFLNMQYAFISNPIKKLQLLFFMNEIYEQRAKRTNPIYYIIIFRKTGQKEKTKHLSKVLASILLTTVSGIRKRYKLKSVKYQKIVS